MRVLYAVTCEDASVRPDGRVDLHGVFHQLYAPAFPAQQDHLTLAAVIEWEPAERGRIAFRIDLADPGGAPALTINGHSDVGAVPTGEAPPQTRLVLPMEGVVFPAAGTYTFQLYVGDEQMMLAPLHLIENPNAG